MLDLAMPHTIDPVLIAAIDTFIDLMARRPVLPGMRSFSSEDIGIIDVYAKKFGISHAGLMRRICRRRRELEQELLGIVDKLTKSEPAVACASQMGASEGGLTMPLLTLGLGDVSLEIFHEFDVVIDDRITLRVRGDQPADNRLKMADAAGESFNFEPQVKIVIGRHGGVSSIELYRAYQAHLSSESQDGGAE